MSSNTNIDGSADKVPHDEMEMKILLLPHRQNVIKTPNIDPKRNRIPLMFPHNLIESQCYYEIFPQYLFFG